MTFSEFKELYDNEGSIVLLEGKRKVLKEDEDKLTALGRFLASNTENITFRSGNALGSDYLFSQGVAEVDHKRLQVITPYSGHRKKTNLAHDTISLEDVDITQDQDIIYFSKSNKKMKSLVDRYTSGTVNRYTIKAAYIIRDTLKVLGTKDIGPSTFAFFYDDLKKPMQGGTGHTMKVCDHNAVPFMNQEVWFKWLD